MQLTAEDIKFVDTVRENNEASQFDFASFLFLFLTACMFIAVVVSTIASLHWMRQRKMEALEKLNSEDSKAEAAPKSKNGDKQEGLVVAYEDDTSASD